MSKGLDPPLLLYLIAPRHCKPAQPSIFFPKEVVIHVNDISAGLEEYLVTAMNFLPAAARPLVIGLCQPNCTKDWSTRCKFLFFD